MSEVAKTGMSSPHAVGERDGAVGLLCEVHADGRAGLLKPAPDVMPPAAAKRTAADTSRETPKTTSGLAAFSRLLFDLEGASGTTARRQRLAAHLRECTPEDAAWSVRLLSGERLRRLLPVAVLKQAAMALSGLPAWAFEECYESVGDLAETIALLLPGSVQAADTGHDPTLVQRSLADWMTQHIAALREASEAERLAQLQAWWRALPPAPCFALNKLITGGLRVGVSRAMVAAALADAFALPRHDLEARLMHFMQQPASAEAWQALVQPPGAGHPAGATLSGPVPFFLSQSLVVPAGEDAATLLQATLGDAADWVCEWKWDGIRAQLVVDAQGQLQIWSRGEELVTERFPELHSPHWPPGLRLDGELLAWDPASARPRPFGDLQQRIGRKTVSRRLLQEVPVVFMAYDLLASDGEDWRHHPLTERRAQLTASMAHLQATPLGPVLQLSAQSPVSDWAQLPAQREVARAHGTEGLMLKRLDAAYGSGRSKASPRGELWKWKLDPMSVDAVLVYAQRGHGRRSGLYTDYGFALWNEDGTRLLPFAKAYSGLTDVEIREVDQRIRSTITEQFGPVRQVRPTLVVELGFEGVTRSGRHKSGYAVRFPRILRLRPDKPAEEADRVSALQALLEGPP